MCEVAKKTFDEKAWNLYVDLCSRYENLDGDYLRNWQKTGALAGDISGQYWKRQTYLPSNYSFIKRLQDDL
jgi:hypothetical protein